MIFRRTRTRRVRTLQPKPRAPEAAEASGCGYSRTCSGAGPGGEVKTMALFGAVSSKEVDAFAKELAEELAKRYPPALDKSGGPTLSEKRLTRILEDVCN